MAEKIEPKEIERLRGRLRERLSVLIEEYRDELSSQEQGGYDEIASEVRDLGDEAAADVLLDSRLFDIQRDAGELREVREALDRMEDGSYGLCTNCGRPIELERLRVQSAAARCIDCQRRFERDYGTGRDPRQI